MTTIMHQWDNTFYGRRCIRENRGNGFRLFADAPAPNNFRNPPGNLGGALICRHTNKCWAVAGRSLGHNLCTKCAEYGPDTTLIPGTTDGFRCCPGGRLFTSLSMIRIGPIKFWRMLSGTGLAARAFGIVEAPAGSWMNPPW